MTGLKCARMTLSSPGQDGRRQPVPDPDGAEFVLPCDQVILAIGQEKLAGLMDAFGVDRERGYVKVDGELRTSNPQVFAGGDIIRSTGEAMTVTATEDGKIAARGIHRWLERAAAAD